MTAWYRPHPVRFVDLDDLFAFLRHLDSKGFALRMVGDDSSESVEDRITDAAEGPRSERRWLSLGVYDAPEATYDAAYQLDFSSMRGRQPKGRPGFSGGVALVAASRTANEAEMALHEFMSAVDDFTVPMTRAQINSETPVFVPKRQSEHEREQEIATTSARTGARWGTVAGLLSGLAGGVGGALIARVFGG